MTTEKKPRKPRRPKEATAPQDDAIPLAKIQGKSKAEVGPVTKKPKPVMVKSMASRLAPPSYRQKVAAACGPGTLGGGGGGGGGTSGGGSGGITGNFGYGGTINSAGGAFYSPELSTDFLQLPQSLNEQWNYYRFFYNNEPFVGQAIDIHTEIPLSKIRLARPAAKDPKMSEAALRFCEGWVERIGLLRHLMGIVHEYYLIGEAFIFCEDANPEMPRDIREEVQIRQIVEEDGTVSFHEEWTERPDADERATAWMKKHYKGWTDIRVLPPEQVHIETFQFTPEILIELIPDAKTKWLLDQAASGDLRARGIAETIDPVVRKAIMLGENIPLNRDPDAGSFVYYMANKKSPYEPRGHSILQRCLLPGTPITVKRGDIVQEIPVEEVDPDTDLLLTHKGRFRRCQKGTRPVHEPITILEVDGLDVPLRLTSDHEVLVVREDGEEEWCEAGKLRPGDTVREAHVVPEREGITEIDLQEWWAGRVLQGAKRPRPNRFGLADGTRELRVVEAETLQDKLIVSFEYPQDDANRIESTRHMCKLVEWLSTLEEPLTTTSECVANLLQIPYVKFRSYVVLLRRERGLKTERKHLPGHRGNIATIWHPLPKGTTVPGEYLHRTLESPVAKIRVDESFCYILGNWLGDGCVWMSKERLLGVDSLGWCAGHTEMGHLVLERVRAEIRQSFPDLEITEGHLWDGPDVQSENFRLEDELLARWWKDQFGHTAQGKRLPAWIFDLGESCIRALICGMMDTDGGLRQCDSNGSTQFKVELDNLKLISQLQLLCSRIGLSTSRSWHHRRAQVWNQTWTKGGVTKTVDRLMAEKDYPFFTCTKCNEIASIAGGSVKGQLQPIEEKTHPNALKTKFRNGWLTRKIKSVELLPYNGSVYSFDVEEDHSHVTRIVTHNCIRAIVHQDLIRQASAMIVSRHMTPVRLVYSADNAMDVADVELLREQVDQALQDPDFSIISNFQITWEELPANGRMLETSAENELYLRQIYAGLGVTESLLSGESSYSGDRINLEIVNTRYMLLRELLQNLVYENFFKPMCRRMGFVEEDADGNLQVVCPRLSFTRLPIKDSADIFEHMMQLYMKGSLPVNFIYDLLNIDPVEANEQLMKDVFTLRDPNMNEAIRNALSGAGQKLGENSNLAPKLAEDFGLDYQEQKEGGRF